MQSREIADENAVAAPEEGGTPGAPGGLQVPSDLRLNVQLPIFEGPLDLLLHLVREHKLDILDIPISFITDRYVEMLEKMQELNLDVAGEYLLMAATLAHIKSRMLLPRPEPEAEDEEEEGDPRNDLVRRLLAYQKYREAANMLSRQDLLGRDVFARTSTPGPLPLDPGELGLREVSVFKLIEGLDSVLKRVRPEVAHEVMREEVSVADRISSLVERLREERNLSFLALFDDATTQTRIIATFLALLEMAKLGLARIQQAVEGEENAGEIFIAAAEGLLDRDDVTPTSVDEYR
ncbi:MAG: segregation/condensation protein A [Deltaproteobacteria bacterium]|nr:segregation/condensation protein A [Deltaproteobacteria bacterium]